MPRPTREQIRSALDFQHTYQWEVGIIRPPIGVPIDQNRWNLQCQTHELPRKVVETSTFPIRGHDIHEPGRVTVPGTLAINLYETTDAFVRELVANWVAAVENRQAPLNLLSADLRFTSLGNDGFDPNYAYSIVGCYFEDSTPASFEGGNSETCTLGIDVAVSGFH